MVIFRDDPLRHSRLIWIRHAKRETMTVARRKRYRHWPRRNYLLLWDFSTPAHGPWTRSPRSLLMSQDAWNPDLCREYEA